MRNKTEKNKISLLAAKVLLLVLSAVYCLFMPLMTALGLLYNSASYGRKLTAVGVLLMLSALLMSSAVIMCFFKHKRLKILSVIFAAAGFTLCMIMLHILCVHADSSGWTNKFTLQPISAIYRRRLLPCILPVSLIAAFDLHDIIHI